MNGIERYTNDVYKIIGAAMEVHRELGFGLLESIYRDALSIELTDNGINNVREVEAHVVYKNRELGKGFRMDIVANDIIIELKSVSKLCSAHRAQLCNYLRLTNKEVGLLINFGTKSLQGERWIRDANTNECYMADKNMTPINVNYNPFDDEDNNL